MAHGDNQHDPAAREAALAGVVAHPMQARAAPRNHTAGGGWVVRPPGDGWERDADRYAAHALAGEPAPGTAAPRLPAHDAGRCGRTVTVVPGTSRVLQRHISFEHRLLGDVPTADLVVERHSTIVERR